MANMSRFERRVEVDYGSFAERRLNLALTLIVATVIAAASAYVLSGALLGPGYGPAHRTAAATWHARRAFCRSHPNVAALLSAVAKTATLHEEAVGKIGGQELVKLPVQTGSLTFAKPQ
jgi:hypothetical protein